MLLEICKSLNFPEESLGELENAYRRIMETPEAAQAFSLARESMLHPDCNVFAEAAPVVAEAAGVHPYTVNILLQISCVEALEQFYADKETYEKQIGVLRHRLLLCKKEYGVWGNSYGLWQWMFHEWQCVRLGRLLFEPLPHFRGGSYGGIRIGDPVILIHIPEGSPLDMESVMDSLRQGYAYFRNRYPNGVVPFVTESWLLYPPYMDSVFPKDGNIQKFAALFHILSETVDETYENFPSVFGCAYKDADFSKLPQKTSLQRNLLAYLQQGNPMGEAYGIFFYGKDGIIREDDERFE